MAGFRECLFFPNPDDLPVFNGAGFLAQVVDGVPARHARSLSNSVLEGNRGHVVVGPEYVLWCIGSERC